MKRMVKDIMMGADPILPDEPLTSDQEKQVHQGVFDQLDSINNWLCAKFIWVKDRQLLGGYMLGFLFSWL